MLIDRDKAIEAIDEVRDLISVTAYCAITERLKELPSAERVGIPIEWLEEKLTNHPELPYAVTDGIIAVLELWNNECGARMVSEDAE